MKENRIVVTAVTTEYVKPTELVGVRSFPDTELDLIQSNVKALTIEIRAAAVLNTGELQLPVDIHEQIERALSAIFFQPSIAR